MLKRKFFVVLAVFVTAVSVLCACAGKEKGTAPENENTSSSLEDPESTSDPEPEAAGSEAGSEPKEEDSDSEDAVMESGADLFGDPVMDNYSEPDESNNSDVLGEADGSEGGISNGTNAPDPSGIQEEDGSAEEETQWTEDVVLE